MSSRSSYLFATDGRASFKSQPLILWVSTMLKPALRTEEMIPKWFDVSSPLEQSNHVSETFNQLPYERMVILSHRTVLLP